MEKLVGRGERVYITKLRADAGRMDKRSYIRHWERGELQGVQDADEEEVKEKEDDRREEIKVDYVQVECTERDKWKLRDVSKGKGITKGR